MGFLGAVGFVFWSVGFNAISHAPLSPKGERAGCRQRLPGSPRWSIGQEGKVRGFQRASLFCSVIWCCAWILIQFPQTLLKHLLCAKYHMFKKSKVSSQPWPCMTPTTRDTGAVTVRKVLSPGGWREGGGQRGRQFAGMRKLLQENSEESMCVCLGLDWEHELNIKTILFSKHESHSPK